MDAATPPPDGIGQYGEALMMAAFNGITETDVSDIVGGLVKRAKEGHTASVKTVLDFVSGAARRMKQIPPAPPFGESARKVDPDDDDSVVILPSKVPVTAPVKALRRLVARILADEGTTHLAGLAAQCELTDDETRHVLGCDWFAEGPHGWALTPAGRREAK